jgi:hypothetical protein
VNSLSFHLVQKSPVRSVDGTPTVTTRVVVSADAKTLTATQTGKNDRGETVNNVILADKQ